jgi:hypothetical protein
LLREPNTDSRLRTEPGKASDDLIPGSMGARLSPPPIAVVYKLLLDWFIAGCTIGDVK